MKHIIYCRECGLKLLESEINLEEVVEYSWGGSYKPYHKYDEKTGKRQKGVQRICPKWSLFKFWKHDKFNFNPKE